MRAWVAGHEGEDTLAAGVPTLRRRHAVPPSWSRPWVRRTPVLEVEVARRPGHAEARAAPARRRRSRCAARSPACSPRRSDRPALVAASGGNHGLAVAHVGQRARPADAGLRAGRARPRSRCDAIAGWAPRCTRSARRTPRRSRPAVRRPARPGVLALHAYDAPGTVAGQGTRRPRDRRAGAGRRHRAGRGRRRRAGGRGHPGPRRQPARRAGGRGRAGDAARPCTRRSTRAPRSRVEVGGVAADALGASTVGGDRLRGGTRARRRARCWSTDDGHRRGPPLAVASTPASRPSRPARPRWRRC